MVVVGGASLARAGHHSTSDDSSAYRDVSDIDFWRTTASPLVRLRTFMEAKGWWDEDQEKAMRTSERKAVLKAMLAVRCRAAVLPCCPRMCRRCGTRACATLDVWPLVAVAGERADAPLPLH